MRTVHDLRYTARLAVVPSQRQRVAGGALTVRGFVWRRATACRHCCVLCTSHAETSRYTAHAPAYTAAYGWFQPTLHRLVTLRQCCGQRAWKPDRRSVRHHFEMNTSVGERCCAHTQPYGVKQKRSRSYKRALARCAAENANGSSTEARSVDDQWQIQNPYLRTVPNASGVIKLPNTITRWCVLLSRSAQAVGLHVSHTWCARHACWPALAHSCLLLWH